MGYLRVFSSFTNRAGYGKGSDLSTLLLCKGAFISY